MIACLKSLCFLELGSKCLIFKLFQITLTSEASGSFLPLFCLSKFLFVNGLSSSKTFGFSTSVSRRLLYGLPPMDVASIKDSFDEYPFNGDSIEHSFDENPLERDGTGNSLDEYPFNGDNIEHSFDENPLERDGTGNSLDEYPFDNIGSGNSFDE